MSENGVGYGTAGEGGRKGKRGRWRVGDLPPSVVAMIRPEDRAALGLSPRTAANAGGAAGATSDAEGGEVRARRGGATKAPNKTEARYRAEKLRGLDARYEALSFLLQNGHRYTPDWVVLGTDGRIECHEVKGAYRFGSHGRARLAFDQAKAEFPGFGWVWATWTGKAWEVQR